MSDNLLTAIAIIIIILLVGGVYKSGGFSAKGVETGGTGEIGIGRQYVFFPRQNSEYGNIKTMGVLANNIAGLKTACDNTSGCVAFDTNGVLKSKIEPQMKWVTWTQDPNKGLYVLSGAQY